MTTPIKAAVLATVLSLNAPFAFAQERDLALEDSNKALVQDFYNNFFNKHDIGAASVVAEDYIQHNPHVPDGKKPFVDYFSGYFVENPEARNEIIRAVASGDLVWLHVRSTNGAEDRGQAVVDIFRVEDGRIVEHWDVIQPVPEKAENANTMF